MRPFHVMAKPIGAACNLRCDYCYYLPKADSLGLARNRRLSDAMLEHFVRAYLESQPDGEVCFSWQGGEPTLRGLAFFLRAIELQQHYRRAGQRVSNQLQTNGVLLDDAWCGFLRRHGFVVGLSVDGPAALHDASRVDRRGRPTLSLVQAAVNRLHDHDIAFATLTVVGQHNAHAAGEVYSFLTEQLDARVIQLIPCVEPLNFAAQAPGLRCAAAMPFANDAEALARFVTRQSVTPVQWGDFLCSFFDLWHQRDLGRVVVNLFESAIVQLLGYPALQCSSAEQCGQAVALEADGSVYSCDHYVYSQYCLGQIDQQGLAELVDSPQQRAFGASKRDSLPGACRLCPYLGLCWGECPRNRFTRANNGEPGLNYLCTGQRRFFKHALPELVDMARVIGNQLVTEHKVGQRS